MKEMKKRCSKPGLENKGYFYCPVLLKQISVEEFKDQLNLNVEFVMYED